MKHLLNTCNEKSIGGIKKGNTIVRRAIDKGLIEDYFMREADKDTRRENQRAMYQQMRNKARVVYV